MHGNLHLWRAERWTAVVLWTFVAALPSATARGGEGFFDDHTPEPKPSAWEVRVRAKGLQDADAKRRIEAAGWLAKCGSAAAVDPLTAALGDKDSGVRVAVVEALGALGDRRATTALTDLLDAKQPVVLRKVALRALWRLEDPKAIPAIAKLMQDKDEDLAGTAAATLGVLGPKAVGPLIGTLGRDRRGYVRSEAVLALGRLKAARAVPAIEKAMYAEEGLLAADAIRALREIGDPAVETLLRLLKHPRPGMRTAGAQALGRMGAKRAAAPLAALLPKAEPIYEAHAILEALAKVGDAKSVPAILAVLEGREVRDGLRVLAVRALGGIGNPDAARALVKALSHRSPLLRAEAATALGSCPAKIAFEPLVKALDDKAYPVHIAALRALVVQKNPKLVDELAKRLPTADTTTRMHLAEALGDIGGAKVVAPLMVIVRDADPFIRLTAMGALRRTRGPAVVAALIKTLANPHPEVRAAGVKALGDMEASEAVEPLIRLLAVSKKYARVRVAAVEALGKLRDARAYVPLLQATEDKDEDVRRAATSAVGQVRTPETKQLMANLKHPLAAVRRAAIEGLGRWQEKSAVGPVIVALDDGDAGVRAEAARVLGEFADASAVDGLIERLADKDARVRAEAAKSLAQFPCRRAVPALQAALQDDDRDVRRGAAHALRWLQDIRTAPALFEAAFAEKDKDARQTMWEALKALGPAAMDVALERLTDARPMARVAVAGLMSDVLTAEAVGPLLACLKHKNDIVRTTAAMALRWLNDIRAVEALLILAEDPDDTTRSSAIDALARLARPPEEDALSFFDDTPPKPTTQPTTRPVSRLEANLLRRVLQAVRKALRDQDPAVRKAAVEAVGELEDRQSRAAVRKLLGGTGPDLLRAAAWAAGQLKDRQAARALGRLARHESKPVAEATIESLGQIGGPEAIAALAPFVAEADYGLRHEAGEALCRVGDRRGVPACIESIGEWAWPNDAETVLAEMKDPAAIPLLINVVLADRSGNTRACRLLAGYGKSAVGPILKALSDEKRPGVHGLAVALGQSGDPRVLRPLLAMLKSPEAILRCGTAEALGELGDLRAVQPLLAGLKDVDHQVRAEACKALGKLADPAAVVPLVAALKDGRSWVREEAANALGKLGDPTVVDRLWPLALEESQQVRVAALLALARLGAPEAVPALAKEAAAGGDWALEALAAMPKPISPKALAVLTGAIRHESSGMRCVAFVSLSELGDRRAIPALVRALPDWDLGPSAAETLAKLKWKPRTPAQRVHDLVARSDRDALLARWPETKDALLADLAGREKTRMENAILALIAIGKEEAVDNLLVVMQGGDREWVAHHLLYSGHPKLRRGAMAWLLAKGHTLLPSVTSETRWGEFPPDWGRRDGGPFDGFFDDGPYGGGDPPAWRQGLRGR